MLRGAFASVIQLKLHSWFTLPHTELSWMFILVFILEAFAGFVNSLVTMVLLSDGSIDLSGRGRVEVTHTSRGNT